ncbi:EAL domain-containing protein [Celerinatantimonas sp. YJH-8]|uniref:sensor domain-containing protein n=1 Tax=Celerinatantimonas sp. YJH-8 TaxID=3228714 RepID=UPI0038BFDA0C
MIIGLWIFTGLVCIFAGWQMWRRKQAYQQLAESQAGFQSFFNQSFQYATVLDRNGVIIAVNKPTEQLLNKTFEELQGAYFCDIEVFQAQVELRSKLKAALELAEQGAVGWANVEFMDDYNKHHFIDVSFQPVLDEHQQLQQILVEGRNINRLHAARQQLEQSRLEFWTLFEENPLLLCRINNLGMTVRCNRQASVELGREARDLEGNVWGNFYADPELRSTFMDYLQHAESGQVYSRDLCYLHCTGKHIWFNESIRKLPNSHDFLLVGENITEKRRLTEELAYQASHDFLTGMYNRSYFEQQLEIFLESAQNGKKHALMFLDLDQFKVINDTQGHLAGDQVLKHTALLLINTLPQNAVLARLGGDEFGILLPEITLEDARRIGQLLVRNIAAFNFHWENKIFNLAGSIGLNMVDSNSGGKYRVMAEVDSACYAAKEQGRNRLHVFELDDEQLIERQDKMRWVEPIQQAIREERFVLYAQPIVAVTHDEPGLHYEVLARMQDKQGILIAPGIFLQVAEHYNLADRVDMVIINKIFDWLEAHPAHVAQLSLCSINLSGLSLSNHEFVNWLLSRLQRLSIPLHKLCFETTETVAISHIQVATQFFSEIKSMGCKIALDDFGSGLSSFGYLKTLPIDFLKIDGLFIRELPENAMDLAMVKSINEVAHVLGKQTIAEFVENEAAMQCLTEIGVDFAQGYYIDKPMPIEHLPH